jgi:hypothetical protein
VKLQFSVDDGDTIELSRNPFTGRCTLNTGTEDKVLDSPWNPFTHLSFRLKEQWQCSIKGHEIIIEKSALIFFRISTANLSNLCRWGAGSGTTRVLGAETVGRSTSSN